MQIETAILDFCSKHKLLLVYGAGGYARTLHRYLQACGIRITACVISGAAPDPPIFRKSVPIYSISEYPVRSNEKYGIFLALHPDHYTDIFEKIEIHFPEDVDTFRFTQEELSDLMYAAQYVRRDKVLYGARAFSEEEKTIFERRISEITKDYKIIRLQYLLAFTIGFLGWSWMWACRERALNQDGVFHLYYPVTWYEQNELDSPNNELLYKESSYGIEVISKRNIRFWNYFLLNYKEIFHISNDFNVDDHKARFCRFVLEHKENYIGEYITFTPSEEMEAKKYCTQELNLKEPFVAFAVRDSVYSDVVRRFAKSNERKLSDEFRGSKIENLRLAMKNLSRKGIQTVRMGAIAAAPIDWNGTVDYAYNYRSEFMDLWLFSRCEFFVSNMSGIQAIPQLFKKPLVAIDTPCLTQRGDYLMFINRDYDLAIYRKYWHTKEKRYLTFREMLAYEIDENYSSRSTLNACFSYCANGIVAIDNTPEEIDDVVQEMYARIHGTMEYTTEDETLQQRFFDIIDSFPMKKNCPFMFRVGAKFLRQNAWLLD